MVHGQQMIILFAFFSEKHFSELFSLREVNSSLWAGLCCVSAAGDGTVLMGIIWNNETYWGDFIDLHVNEMLFFFFEHVTPVYIYSILYVVSLFCCHACIMQRGLCGGYSCRCVLSYLPLGPSLLCPGIPASSQLHGHLPAPGSPPFLLSAPGFAISWWATADTPLRGDYSVRLCSTNHPVSSPRTWMVISEHAKAQGK